MDKVIRAMKALQSNWNTKADEYAHQAADGLLTPDEAAKCLAGADLKMREAIRESSIEPGKGHDLSVAMQAIDSRLPEYDGLVLGRHV